MSYESALNREIYAELDDLAAKGAYFRAEFIAHKICSLHADGLADSEHRDFWRHCGYQEVRDQVRRCINKRAGDRVTEDERQYRLPGYEHVHAYYVVKRDGNDVGVPAYDLSDDEIDQKSQLYRRMGRACFDHARELQRFKNERKSRGAA